MVPYEPNYVSCEMNEGREAMELRQYLMPEAPLYLSES